MIDTLLPTMYEIRAMHDDDRRFTELAAELGARFAPHAARHDRDNTFVHDNFAVMRESGYLRLAVPEELGGLGATMRQVCYAQAELARGCASTALAVNMHHYLVLSNTFRWRKGAPGAEKVLQRVANEGLVLMTSGGSDGIYPSGMATRNGDGFRVNGRKMFCSQAPVAGVLATMAAYDDPAEGRIVLLMGIPTSSPGFEIGDAWDSLGMRATASQDVFLNDVQVGDAQVIAKRPWGKVDAALRNAGIHFAPPVASVYYGVAVAARDEAVRVVRSRSRDGAWDMAADATVQRQTGLMDNHLRTAWWSLTGALADLGDDYALDDVNLATVMIAKRHVLAAAQEVVDLAMSVVGGAAYYKRSPLEQAYRDVRAGAFHPLTPERTLIHAGRLALDQPADTIW